MTEASPPKPTSKTDAAETSDATEAPAVGIDLGTTYSAVSYLDRTGRAETVRNAEGELTTPSAVFFDRSRPIVGAEAIEAGTQEPDRLALFAKRDIGEANFKKKIRGELLPAEVIQAIVLRRLKDDAELIVGPFSKAVITVPAFFNEPCRKAVQDAGRLAGIDVLDIINEPTAAAITYGVAQGFIDADGNAKSAERVLVYDLGGGTFDVTVMEIAGSKFRTIATAGDVYLGGIDWDRRIVDFVAEAYLEQHGNDPRGDNVVMQDLMKKATQAKHALTQRDSVSIFLPFEGNRFRVELTRQEFGKRCEDLVERTLMTVGLVLKDAGVAWSDLTRLILVGGSTRMPMVRDELVRQSGIELDRSLSPDEAISHGAAIYAGMLIGGAESLQSGISVRNVNSHDLGVLALDPKTGDQRRQIMIPKNSALPAAKRVRFRTHKESQVNVKIEVVEGGNDKGAGATRIGQCIVDGLPNDLPKGTSVDLRFDYATDGRLKVTASLPDIDHTISMSIDRAAGLDEASFQAWQKRIDSGFGDDTVASPIVSNEDLIDEDEMIEIVEQPADGPVFPGIQTDSSKTQAAEQQPTPSQTSPFPVIERKPTDAASQPKPASGGWRSRGKKLSD